MPKAGHGLKAPNRDGENPTNRDETESAGSKTTMLDDTRQQPVAKRPKSPDAKSHGSNTIEQLRQHPVYPTGPLGRKIGLWHKGCEIGRRGVGEHES